MQKDKINVWDLPTRLFHWLLVFTILLCYISIEVGGVWSDWHSRLGGFALALTVFRVIWGFWGNTQARFSSFLPTPSRLIKYFNGQWQGIGHSPLGGLAVIGLLGLTILIIITGLFANDDITLYGPLYPLVTSSTSEWMTYIHEVAFNGLLVLIGLHLLAITFYWLVKNNNLVKPMITGKKEVESMTSLDYINDSQPNIISLLISIGIATLVVWLVFGNVITDLFVTSSTKLNPQEAVSSHQW